MIIFLRGGRKLLGRSFPSPTPLSFKNFETIGLFLFSDIVRSTVVLWYLKPTTRVILSGVRLRTQSKPVGLPSIAKVGSRVVKVELSVRDPDTTCRAPRSTPLRSAQDDTDGLYARALFWLDLMQAGGASPHRWELKNKILCSNLLLEETITVAFSSGRRCRA